MSIHLYRPSELPASPAPSPDEGEPDIGSAQRLERLLAVAQGKKRGLILTHDNPDPDALATAAALAFLLEARAGVPTQIAYGGVVGRAENLAMIELLHLPAQPVETIRFEEFDLLGLVDTQPVTGNHSLPRERVADIVIDHHPVRPNPQPIPFADLGRDLGATCTILVEYLRAAQLEPPKEIATALFYGIKSDTRDLLRETHPSDLDSYFYLLPSIDRSLLVQIEHPSLPAAYFALTHEAIERARIHGQAVVVTLDEVYSPDAIPEVCERFLSLQGMRWALAFGTYRGALYVSVRTLDPDTNVGKQIRAICRDLGGTAGGHGSMAGARIPLGSRRLTLSHLLHRVTERFLEQFGIPDRAGVPLLQRAGISSPAVRPRRATPLRRS